LAVAQNGAVRHEKNKIYQLVFDYVGT